ncbi:MAG: hypothetical protein ABI639_11510 [Thermoanaerobaculia bacterium]
MLRNAHRNSRPATLAILMFCGSALRLAGAARAQVVSEMPPASEDAYATDAFAAALREDPELAAALSTSSDGLVEEQLPDGGVVVRLEGRFQSVMFATLDGKGELNVAHRLPSRFAAPPSSLFANLNPQVCLPLDLTGTEVARAPR